MFAFLTEVLSLVMLVAFVFAVGLGDFALMVRRHEDGMRRRRRIEKKG